ncbi:gephyrin-like molybdotransferase Glp [Pedobacter sp. Leaf176]|uniref:molybdopterin molybdotransferase MoeA n=1 Tax=Pedobacter sp. Leaf176 TaxID=1736286 RepID=UPI0006F59594|nr:gephyrin-like molybdotransferase Glp [Pedobacter sp. Leaf176]KQR70419.1 molybdopterin-binding protein [Pedobacter sp. Leaf176]
MIGVEEAKKLISENISPLKSRLKPLEASSEHILAQDVSGAYDIPAFRQSSMDGYAIIFDDKDKELDLVGEMAAGTANQFILKNGQTSRIFTGAPLPEGADTVVMQERTIKNGNQISFSDDKLISGSNVRKVGSEIRSGELAMQKGDLLTPAAMAFLAGIGISEVEVYPMPRVAIILTGNELQQPGLPLNFGQVYESNSYSLSAALKKEGIHDIEILKAEDTLEILTEVLKSALENNDVVLLTGGVSVGDYDFVIKAAGDCGVKQIFHKVKQKPGKPLFFGKQKDKVIFGLPGNPSSVLNCYYNYVVPAVKMLSNKQNSILEISAELTHNYTKPKGLTHFLKGNYKDGKATPLGAQESYRLSSFAQANCLIQLNEEDENFTTGKIVNVILI